MITSLYYVLPTGQLIKAKDVNPEAEGFWDWLNFLIKGASDDIIFFFTTETTDITEIFNAL